MLFLDLIMSLPIAGECGQCAFTERLRPHAVLNGCDFWLTCGISQSRRVYCGQTHLLSLEFYRVAC